MLPTSLPPEGSVAEEARQPPPLLRFRAVVYDGRGADDAGPAERRHHAALYPGCLIRHNHEVEDVEVLDRDAGDGDVVEGEAGFSPF